MKSLARSDMSGGTLRIGDPNSVTHARVRSVTLREIIGSLEPLDSKITAGIDALKKRPVVGVTASSLHSGKYDKVLEDFDLVVIDEAAQLTVPATVGCISFGKKFVLIGDHRQLPPVVQSEGWDMFEKSRETVHGRVCRNRSLKYCTSARSKNQAKK